MQYGLGTSPTAWTTIVNSTTPVTSGVLGTFNPLHLPNGQNVVLRLIVNDQVGNIKTITVPIQAENVLITNVSSSPQFINPSLGQTSTLTYTLDRTANVTIELYRTFVTIGGGGDGVFGREYIGNLITNALKTAGVNTLVWDGKYLGATVNHSAYTYVIKASVGAKIGLYDPAYVAGSSSLSSLSLVPSNYNAYANEPVLINYTLNTPSWVTMGTESPVNFRRFIEGQPRNSGANTEVWDGRDGLGGIIPTPTFTISMKTMLLPSVSTVVQDKALKFDQLNTEAYLILPAYNEVSTIRYSITRTADVTIRVIDPNGNNWIIEQVNGQTAGTLHTAVWNGTNGAGNMVSTAGHYRIEVSAVDALSNTTAVRSANITVYR